MTALDLGSSGCEKKPFCQMSCALMFKEKFKVTCSYSDNALVSD